MANKFEPWKYLLMNLIILSPVYCLQNIVLMVKFFKKNVIQYIISERYTHLFISCWSNWIGVHVLNRNLRQKALLSWISLTLFVETSRIYIRTILQKLQEDDFVWITFMPTSIVQDLKYFWKFALVPLLSCWSCCEVGIVRL